MSENADHSRGEPMAALHNSALLAPATETLFRNPTAKDGPAVHALIERCPPLDTNSLYANLLQCSHFADSCVLAEQAGALVGWISGYRPPHEPDALFVWQVAVAPEARGQNLGVRMLDALFQMPAAFDATRLITTVTPSNQPSRAMFARFAEIHGCQMEARAYFDRDSHLGGLHESEELISIGPLDAARHIF